MVQSKGKLLYGNGFTEQSIEMIVKMFNEKMKEYENCPFSISMWYTCMGIVYERMMLKALLIDWIQLITQVFQLFF